MIKKVGFIVGGLVLVSVAVILFLTSDKKISAEDSVTIKMFNDKITELENSISELNDKIGELTIGNEELTNKLNEVSIGLNQSEINITSNKNRITKIEAREDYFYEKTKHDYTWGGLGNISNYILENLK